MAEKLKCSLLSWEEVIKFSEQVAKKIKLAGFIPDYIVAITRGGWIPAVLFSDYLQMKNLLSLKIEHWGITARKDKKAHLIIPLGISLSEKKILLVDDLTDTGESIQLALQHLREQKAKEIKVATLIHKSQSPFIPDFYAKKTEEWRWIILPWNVNEDLGNLMKKISERKLSSQEMKKKLKKEFDLRVDEKIIEKIMENVY